MEKENKEVIEEITDQPIEEVVEEKEEKTIDESKFQSAGDDSVIKIDLSNTEQTVANDDEDTTQESTSAEKTETTTDVEPQEGEPVESVLQEITEEEIPEVEEEVEEAVAEAEATGKPLPENIQKLVDFMEETGGDLGDYVNLNRDISKMDNSEILNEYYRDQKPHLNAEERSFLLEETFGFDEEVDEPKDIKRKKIALKEQVAEAKAYLDGQKSKYYEEIKAGSKLTDEQQEAINFFNRYNKESKDQNELNNVTKKAFKQKTDNLFNSKFKGFEYNVGDKRYRFNVNDVEKVKTTQSDINNFVNKFIDKKTNTINDAAGYHKSLFTAMNPDTIAKHFYEQGQADAIKGQVAKDKNINLNPRQTHGETNVGGVKYRVLGNDSNDFKFKIKSKNKK